MARSKKEKYNIWQKAGLFFYDRKVFTTLLWVALVIFGSLSYTLFMRKEGFPSVNVPLGIIQVVAFDDSAEDIDSQFTRPLIEAVRQDERVKDVNSTSSNQGASLQISYEDNTDVQAALDEVKSRVGASLPQTGQVVYVKVNASKLTAEGADLLLSVHGKGLTAEALDAAAQRLEPIIKDNVALAQSVTIYPSIETLQNPQTGESESRQLRFDRYYDKETGEALPSVAVGIEGVPGVDQLELYDQVLAVIGSEKVDSVGAEVKVAVDFAESIRDQVSGLQKNLFEGLIVVFFVSFLLISLRASIVTAISMAATVIMTIGVLHILGYTINTITLFSLVLCLALIVDDTTIIVEAIDAGLEKGKQFRQVVAQSLKKIVRASATGTLTTMLAFAPMLFIGGILGEFIRAIPITIIISLAISLISSFLFIPLMMKFSFGKSLERHERRHGFIHRLESRVGNILARALIASTKTKFRSLSTKLHALLVAAVVVIAGGMIFRTVEFNIFPVPKDGNEIAVSARVRNQEAATITTTEQYADAMLKEIQSIVGDDLERATLLARDVQANRNGFGVAVTLTQLHDRDRTSVAIAKELQEKLDVSFPEFKISSESSGVGPPAGNFNVEIKGEDDASARRLAQDMSTYLSSLVLTRIDGTTSSLKDVSISPAVAVTRADGERVVSVSASFVDKDVSTLVDLAQKSVEKEFSSDKVTTYGLANDAVQFDFGQEEENQKSFESMGKAAIPLFISMLLLMGLLFRSVLQAFLILTALPFAFFGVAAGLSLTDNPISFFTMMGIFALVGISVNNSILLTDYSNQARLEGLSAAEAMASSLRARLRPLITTSLTAVLALLPLALDDPFWEGIAFTLIFGLLSSTLLVILVFPYFYLIEESLRHRTRKILRRPV